MHVTKKHCSPASFPQLSSYLSFLSCPLSSSPSFHFRIIYIYTCSHVCIVLNELFPRLFLLLSLTRSLSLPLSISLFLSLSNTLSLSLSPSQFLSPFSPGRGPERPREAGLWRRTDSLAASVMGLEKSTGADVRIFPWNIQTNPLSLSHLALYSLVRT